MPGLNALSPSHGFSKISKRLLSALFQRYSPCYILRLPLDVFVDQIFLYLHVEDVLRLRRVNKAFFLLTHEPIIWKRFLRQIRTPLPPIRPTFRYSDDPMDSEVEQLVIRAVSFEQNWRQPVPKITSAKAIETPYIVLELKFVPGGKYLIASVRDVDSCWFFIMVYCLDHPNGPFPLARMETEAKAFNLDAKFMRYEDKQVLMVGFVQRYYVKDINDDASQYSSKHRIDPPHPMKQEISCFYLDLTVLDALSNPFLDPQSKEWVTLASAQGEPCHVVQTYTSKAEVEPESLTLFEVDGIPHLAIIHIFRTVTFADLTRLHETTSLTLADAEGYPGRPFRVRAIRKLPDQNQILLVRTVLLEDDKHLHLLEMYHIPTIEGSSLEPIYVFPLDEPGEIATRFRISDYGNPRSNSNEWSLPHDRYPPNPISIFMEVDEPEDGIKHWIVWPNYSYQHRRYYYDLEWVTSQTKHVSWGLHTHIAGGAFRSIAYTVSSTDRKDSPKLVELRRYMNPEFQNIGYPLPRVSRKTTILEKELPLRPHNPWCTLRLDPETSQRYAELGVAAVTWDEGSGRLCMASGSTHQIDLLDFGYGTPPDNRAVEWKRSLEVMTDYDDEKTPSPTSGMIHVREPHVPGEWSPYTKYRELEEILV